MTIAVSLSSLTYILYETDEAPLLKQIFEDQANGTYVWSYGGYPLDVENYESGQTFATGWIDDIFSDQYGIPVYALGIDFKGNPSIFRWNLLNLKWDWIGTQFRTQVRPINLILSDLIANYENNMPRLFFFIIINSIIAVFVGLFIGIINPYGRIGVKFNVWFFNRLKGKFGRFLNALQIFNFKRSDNWFIEKHMVYDFNFSSTTSMIRELFVKRWHDIFFLPAALIIFLLTIFNADQFVYDLIDINWFKSLFPESIATDSYEFVVFLVVSLLSAFVTILLAFYYPMIWTYSDMGLKKYRLDKFTGDVERVNNLGFVLRAGFEVFLGFTTLLSLGQITRELQLFFNPAMDPSFRTIVNGSNSFIPWFVLFFDAIGAIAFFLIIISFSVPIIIVVAYLYFSMNHMKVIAETRKKLVIDSKVLLGTIQPSVGFITDDDVIQVYYDDKVEKIEYT